VLAIVPIKALDSAKQRLSAVLSAQQRGELARAMAHDVLSVLQEAHSITRVLVCAGDQTGVELANHYLFDVLPDIGDCKGDLNKIVRCALNDNPDSPVLVVHADMPFLRTEDVEAVASALRENDVVIAPDREQKGSNIVAWRRSNAFAPYYGADSFSRNSESAKELNLKLHVCVLQNAALDIDTAENYAHLQRDIVNAGHNTQVCLRRFRKTSEGQIPVQNSTLKIQPPLSNLQAMQLQHVPLSDALLSEAAALRDVQFGNVITFSKKVFLPLTHLCRDVCHYCTFTKTPRQLDTLYMSLDDVLRIAKQGESLGCKEALLTLGEKPELRYSAARKALAEMGYASTLDYVEAIAGEILKQTGLLPHINAGNMIREEMLRLKQVSASMGIMLESASERLCEPGQAHYGSPDKAPQERLKTIALAGELKVPLTTGILIGIGETRAERIESLLAIRDLHNKFGHIQEIIIQNFRAKPNTKMAAAQEPDASDLIWSIAIARIIFGAEMSIQVPPNLNAGELPALVNAGINDWGGVSPLTKDHVNPEAPWPHLSELELFSSAAGKYLEERLTVYPQYIAPDTKWLAGDVLSKTLALADGEGLGRADAWYTGISEPIPEKLMNATMRHKGQADADLQQICEKAASGKRLDNDAIVRMFKARGAEFSYLCRFANTLREETCGDAVTYVVNRNINYTNICYFRCTFCAFSKGKAYPELRGKPYNLGLDQVVDHAQNAWHRGATEVCMQGGIHPDYTGQHYLDLVEAVKNALPDMHIHAFSPLEIWQGANTLKISVREFLTRLKQAGLNTLPGTAAEILVDEVREKICYDKIKSAEWLEVMQTAHELGFKTTATIMFGHVDSYEHWAEHLLAVRDLQVRSGGFTEFVPLPFVAAEAPMFKRGQSRRGPTFRESVLMHAVSRIVLHSQIDNIQTSWVKMGREGAAACLHAGANDLGGTLMSESITRAAGASHGQEVTSSEMEAIIRSAQRLPKQRTTLYAEPEEQQCRRARAEPPNLIAS